MDKAAESAQLLVPFGSCAEQDGFAFFADVEELAARLHRIERAAREVDRETVARGAQHKSRAAPIAQDLDADGPVVERIAARQIVQGRGRASEL